MALSFFLLIALSLGGWLYLRQSGGTGKDTPSVSDEAKQDKTDSVSAPISFLCSGCGKGLKARPPLAGKKVKCPGCAKNVLVPTARPYAG
jgi:hypothetical protein